MIDDQPQGDPREHRRWRIALVLLVLMAVPIRLAGVTRDFPAVLDGDEQLFVGAALRIMLTGTDSHPNFHPGCTLAYPMALIFRIEEVLGIDAGRWVDRKGFLDAADSDPRWLFLPGRILSCAAGLASLPLVAMLGCALGLSRIASLLAVALMILSLGSRDNSVAVRPDLLETLFMLSAVFLATRSIDRRGRRYLFGAGMAAGLSGATKWPGLIVWVCIPVAILVRDVPTAPAATIRERRALAMIILACGAVLLAASMTAPSMAVKDLLDGGSGTVASSEKGARFLCASLLAAGLGGMGLSACVASSQAVSRWMLVLLRDEDLQASLAGLLLGLLVPTMQVLMRARLLADSLLHGAWRFSLTGDAQPGLHNLIWYVKESLATDLGLPAFVMGLLGIGLWIYRREWRALPLLAFSGVHLAYFVMAPMRYARYMIPITPCIALGVGSAAQELLRRGRRISIPDPLPPRRSATDSLDERVADSVSISGRVRLAWVACFGIVLGAGAWPMANAVQSANLPDTRIQATEWLQRTVPFGRIVAVESNSALPCRSCYHVLTPGTLIQLDGKGGQRPDFVVTSSWVYGHFMAEPGRYAKQIASYASILADYKAIAQFEPAQGIAQGPLVRVYNRIR